MKRTLERNGQSSPEQKKREAEAINRNRPTPRSGLPVMIHRFVPSERFLHWALAIPFVVLYATATAMLLLWAEPQPRSIHLITSWIHRIAGVCLIVFPPLALLSGSRDWRVHLGNIKEAWVWSANDFRWLLLSPLAAVDHRITLPEQGRFNAAEKLNFMMVCATYPLYIATGILIWLPGAAFVPWLLHLAMAALGLALVIGHIFMAAVNPSTRVGLEGMITGWVDREWAKHHYRRWFRETVERRAVKPRARPIAAPPVPPGEPPAVREPIPEPMREPANAAAPVRQPVAAPAAAPRREPVAITEPAVVMRAAPSADSIAWSAAHHGAPPEAAATMPIYVRQRALASLHDHLRSAGNLNVLGFFVGDLCEDPATHDTWIEITKLVRLTKAPPDDKTASVIAQVWPHLQQELQRGGGHLLGWYLSHPFGQAELGADESDAHRRYFTKPWQVALALSGGERGAFYRPSGASAAANGALPFHEVLERESITPEGTKRTRVTWKNYRPDVPLVGAEAPAAAGAVAPVSAGSASPPSITTLLASPAKLRCTTCGEVHAFKSWEQLLQRIFQVEPLFCSNCQGELMPAVGRAAPELAQAVLQHLQQASPDEALVP